MGGSRLQSIEPIDEGWVGLVSYLSNIIDEGWVKLVSNLPTGRVEVKDTCQQSIGLRILPTFKN